VRVVVMVPADDGQGAAVDVGVLVSTLPETGVSSVVVRCHRPILVRR